MRACGEGVRVLVVDEQRLVRLGLIRLLESTEGLDTVCAAVDGAEALSLLRRGGPEDLPHVVLVDVRMTRMDGREFVLSLRARHPRIGLVVLTERDGDEYLFEGLSAGVKGFLSKDAEPEEMVGVIQRVAAGQPVLLGAVAERVISALPSVGAPTFRVRPEATAGQRWHGSGPVLSDRELQVARKVADGASNRELARGLGISEGTVRNHVTNALRKLSLRDRTQLALWYVRWGRQLQG